MSTPVAGSAVDLAWTTALPKVELHCHVEGTMRRETLVALAERRGLALPTRDPRDLYKFDSLDGRKITNG